MGRWNRKYMRPGGSLGATSGEMKLSSSAPAADTPLRAWGVAMMGGGGRWGDGLMPAGRRVARRRGLAGRARATSARRCRRGHGAATARQPAAPPPAVRAPTCGTLPARERSMSPTTGSSPSCCASARMLRESSTPTALKGTMMALKRAAILTNSASGRGHALGDGEHRWRRGGQHSNESGPSAHMCMAAASHHATHPTWRAKRAGSPLPGACRPRAPRLRERLMGERVQGRGRGADGREERALRLEGERGPLQRRPPLPAPHTTPPPHAGAAAAPGNSSTASPLLSRRCMLKADTGTAPKVCINSRNADRPSMLLPLLPLAPPALRPAPAPAPGRPPSTPRSASRPRPAWLLVVGCKRARGRWGAGQRWFTQSGSMQPPNVHALQGRMCTPHKGPTQPTL